MSSRRGLAQAIAAMATVGGAVTASSYLTGAPRFEAQAARYAATTVVLLAIAVALRRPEVRVRRARGHEWLWLFLAATAGQTIYNVALVGAVQHADPAFVASIVSCVPLVLVVAAPLVAGGRLRPGLAGAAAVVVVGAAIVYGGGSATLLGLALSLVALGGEAGFTLFSLRVLDRVGPFSVAVHTSWIAGVQLLLLAWLFGDDDLTVAWSGGAVAAVVYLVAASAFAFVAWFRAVASVGADVAGLATGVIPISAALSGAALGVAPLTASVVVGAALVAIGVTAGARAVSREGRRAAEAAGGVRSQPGQGLKEAT